MGDLSAAVAAATRAVVRGTSKKQVRVWSRFKTYLLSIGITNDDFWEHFNRGQRHKILSAFAQSVREGHFSVRPTKSLKADSVRASLDFVAQAFKLANRPDPRLDSNGKLVFILQRQLQGYKSADPGETPQVAVTGSVLRKFYNLSISPRDKALCELFIGAFFFAMRSCEYIKVQGPRKTKLLAVKNIRFFKGNHQLSHSDPALPFADCVLITFEQQKRDTKNDIITQHQSGDKLLCPVCILASIVQ